jgi:predicted DNA-binding transcriptional regulator AlpA
MKTPTDLAPLLVDAAGVGRLLGYSRATVFQLDSAGKLPRPLRPTGHDPRWRIDELRAWVAGGCPRRDLWEQWTGKWIDKGIAP